MLLVETDTHERLRMTEALEEAGLEVLGVAIDRRSRALARR